MVATTTSFHTKVFIGLNLLLSAAISGHAQTLQGSLTASGISAIYPADSGYNSARRSFNERFSFSPAAVAYPTTVAQVANAVKAGAQNGLQVSARSGGHSYVANGLGGKNGALVVDLSKLKVITVDATKGTAYIETGNRLGDIALALDANGRAIPHGTCPYVGIGGHSASGGFGYTGRMWGLTLDTIVEATIVLSNGTIATCSATQNADLLWAIRGAATSFGIVTSIVARTFPKPTSATIFKYGYDMSVATAVKAVASLQTFATTNLSSKLGVGYNIGKGSSSGRVSLEVSGGWYGASGDLAAALAPLLSQLPTSISWQSKNSGTWIQSVEWLSDGQPLATSTQPDGFDTFYAKSLMTPAASPLSNTALTAFFNYLGNQGYATTAEWFIQFELYGGTNSAVNAVPLDSTAFAHRSSLFTIQLYASSPNYSPPFPSTGLTLLDAMVAAIVNNSPSGWDYGAYPNYLDERLQNWENLYYSSHYPRLQALKRQYDPTGLFASPKSVVG